MRRPPKKPKSIDWKGACPGPGAGYPRSAGFDRRTTFEHVFPRIITGFLRHFEVKVSASVGVRAGEGYCRKVFS